MLKKMKREYALAGPLGRMTYRMCALILGAGIVISGAGFAEGLNRPPETLLTTSEYMAEVRTAVDGVYLNFEKDHQFWTVSCDILDRLVGPDSRIVDSNRDEVVTEFLDASTLYYLELLRNGKLPYTDVIDWYEKGGKTSC